MNRPAITGDLRIEECSDDDLHRYLRIATIWSHDGARPAQDRARLFDVRIIGMSPQAFTLTDFERVDGAEYAQSWIVEG